MRHKEEVDMLRSPPPGKGTKRLIVGHHFQKRSGDTLAINSKGKRV